ncbi:MAG: HAMP domain-containing protein [Desulfomonile tiedjei]|nr:HAMP domain-containing protein [Desulfomonile tiedjei]
MGKRRKLIWQLYPSYLIIVVLSLTGMGLYSFKILKELSQEGLLANLQAQAFLVQELVKRSFSGDRWAELDKQLKRIGASTSTRITVILPSGKVVGDSHENPERMDNHAIRPEIKEALAGKPGSSTRYSLSLNADLAYFAVPVQRDGRVVGVIRTSVPITAFTQVLRPFFLEFFLAGIVILVLAAGVSLYVSRRMEKPIEQIQRGAARFAQGDLQFRVETPRSEELGALAESMNEMAAQLHQRLTTITQQRNELEAVLSAMVEAVLVLDTRERILRVNQSAEKLFQIDATKVRLRSVQEAIRNTDLHRFVTSTLAGRMLVEGEIVIIGDPDKFLQAHGVTLTDAGGHILGALIVLNDISRLRTVEKIRRDFVANVSHELKTPITSIKGFLETLKEGALNDPENAERFLDIVIKHTDRLSLIIEDLLSLSRIERDAEKGEIALETGSIKEVFEAVEKTCRDKAQPKNIRLEYAVDDGLNAEINLTLLEQAIVNLVDNAIKYSEPESSVKVEGHKARDEIVITVQDHGCGISRDHLARIFERFYRVDKARSRKVGGTGLGLSIVRHIVIAHGGRIEVESFIGRGSTFSIHLPA